MAEALQPNTAHSFYRLAGPLTGAHGAALRQLAEARATDCIGLDHAAGGEPRHRHGLHSPCHSAMHCQVDGRCWRFAREGLASRAGVRRAWRRVGCQHRQRGADSRFDLVGRGPRQSSLYPQERGWGTGPRSNRDAKIAPSACCLVESPNAVRTSLTPLQMRTGMRLVSRLSMVQTRSRVPMYPPCWQSS